MWTRIRTPEMKSATEPEVLLARSGIRNGSLRAHECENMSEVKKQEASEYLSCKGEVGSQ